MVPGIELEGKEQPPNEDHFVRLEGATWADYDRLVEIRGDASVPRLTYIDGLLELMSPSFNHEWLKSLIGSLVEAYCLDRGVHYRRAGAWTVRESQARRGAEPDDCFVFGTTQPTRPDLAIEVVWTSGGVDKLELWRALGVREVWYWRQGRIQVYVLRGDRYEGVNESECLPDPDLELVAACTQRSDSYEAIQAFRAELARRR